MARTNKQWIAQKKAKLQKVAARNRGQKRFEYPKRKLSIDEGKEIGAIGAKTNPKGRTFNWFLRGRKICYETRMRVDPDGYRLVKLPSGGLEFVEISLSGRGRKKMIKAGKAK